METAVRSQNVYSLYSGKHDICVLVENDVRSHDVYFFVFR